ncbi:protein-tyrosine phosphatase [Blastococcus xanthinilyticus]|uniref:Protein-tyrosine phosphatase n=2 Tax=Blastococcus xanthinilyticus TaxID=1564164 RepID=A0A5S5CQS5_9ACTN|nr:protein-tyrosine phosphatase [Blastococcus xanthinilyticus]
MVATVPFTVLVVCTGNICRSPLAERVGQAHLSRVLPDPTVLRLDSAGTRAVVGSGMDPASARVLRVLGGDPADFRAQQLTDGIVGSADLTLTMTRYHRQNVLARAPRALSRTFTLVEAASLIDLLGPDVKLPDGDPADRARALVKRMAKARALRPSSAADDVVDPIGQPDEVHAAVGETIAAATRPVLGRFAALLGATADSRT